jgi:8-amino-7-oxononanoate synthase
MTRVQIQDWLRRNLAARLRVSPEVIDVHRPLDEYGIDSMEAVAMTGELETLLKQRIEPTAFWDYRTISALAGFLAGEAITLPINKPAAMSDADVDSMLRKMTGSK